nr:unnamed protein product [Callosobruchus analis]
MSITCTGIKLMVFKFTITKQNTISVMELLYIF